jgi:hypothetical protein
MFIKDMLRRDAQLTSLRNSLGDEHTPVFYSTFADDAGGLHDPITGAVLISPALAQQSADSQRALLARELGRVSAPKRTKRWRIGVAALLLCFILDIILMKVALPLIPELMDAGVATACFWMAVWQFRTLYTSATTTRYARHADAWARARVPDYDDLIGKVMARQSIARYVRATR